MFKRNSLELVATKAPEKKQESELLEMRDARYVELIKLPAVKEALTLLDNLPNGLVYHTKAHTEDVIRETILFALADGVSDGVMEQQVIAAAWHDVGYLERKNKNESIAVDYFKESIAREQPKPDSELEPKPKLDPEISDEIISNIEDTEVIFDSEGKPHLHMARSALGYMLDADVSNFGRKDFFDCMEAIAKENNVDIENLKSRTDFYAFVISLLENHEWHTEGARKLREEQKHDNLVKLRGMYEQDLRELNPENIERKAA